MVEVLLWLCFATTLSVLVVGIVLVRGNRDAESERALRGKLEEERRAVEIELASLKEKVRSQETTISDLQSTISIANTASITISEQLRAETGARASAEAQGARVPELESQLSARLREISELKAKNAELSALVESEKRHVEEKIGLLLQAEKTLTSQFENLANRILDEKSQKFVKQNEDNLEVLLKPLRDGLQSFRSKVEETYDKESKERFSLQREIEKLLLLNNKISEDAINLTNALKGQSKTQGTWGEVILERVLEGSGLTKGREYDVQVSLESEGGNRLQPDVIIRLPEGKHVVIDSKVSLLAYEAFCSADDEENKRVELKRHIDSVQKHVSSLSSKNYQALYGVQSLDFVLMFMPIEPAFMVAVQSDRDLFSEAFKKGIMIVGPSTLLVSLKTIASIWRYEYQNRNAQELARQCASLYDKFVGFVSDLEEIGKKIGATQKSYDDAFGKLKTGKNNLVRQVERIRQLGVKPSKAIPPVVLDLAMDESGDDPEELAAKD